MKIGILTLNLYSNYGGILQAYALQTVLQRMGHEVSVINKFKKPVRLKCAIAPLVYVKRFVKKYIRRSGDVPIFLESKVNREYLLAAQHTQLFISKYITQIHCKDYNLLGENDFDAIVVGSDQVWRPKYFGANIIADAYLNFARKWHIKRIAYAPSFGTDEWEYTSKQAEVCKELLLKFDAISVREESAVELCKENFGVEVMHVLDPTMLLDMSDYVSLVNTRDVSKSNGNLLVYVLDETEDKQTLIDNIAIQKELKPFRVNSKIEDLSAPMSERIQPSVEHWLRGFMDAEFVVTDSFHACVFSILFNKPFVVYGNESRGRARFDSLLKIFGLGSQYVTSSVAFNVCKCANIDWKYVNEILMRYRNLSYTFLRSNI